MLNFRFKNPYRSDEPEFSQSDEEEKGFNQENHDENDFEKNKNFNFISTNINGEINTLIIPKIDIRKILGAKVKIWSRDLETNEIERYFNEELLPNVKTMSSLYTAFFLFEAAIYGLIKRRDTFTSKKIYNKENTNTIIAFEKTSINNVNNNINKNNINNYNEKISELNENNNSHTNFYSYSNSSKNKGIYLFNFIS